MTAVRTTVYFATNRVVAGAGATTADYDAKMIASDATGDVTYGRAFLDGTVLAHTDSAGNVFGDVFGTVTNIDELARGNFSPTVRDDMANSGRNVLVFIHGFANSFDDALTRSAFNREWIAASGNPRADTTIIAFSWPSLGRLIDLPILQGDYFSDQTAAGGSCMHVAAFFDRLLPLLNMTRVQGRQCYLLCHSMGNYVLQAAVQSWFSQNPVHNRIFDEVILAAADERFNSFDFPLPGRLSGLSTLTRRTSIYFSTSDRVLDFSSGVFVNGIQRLGEKGPRGRDDTQKFPPERFRMVDCSGIHDYQDGPLHSHQYYRLSPQVRADIISVF